MRHLRILTLMALTSLAQAQTYEDQELRAVDGGLYDFMGRSVAVTDTHALVGAPNHNGAFGSSGIGYVYERTARGWRLAQEIRSPTPAQSNQFGREVALSDRLAVFGVYADSDLHEDSGAVHVFRRHGCCWQPEEKILPPDRGYGFGVLVAVDDDRLFIKHGWHLHIALRTPSGWDATTRIQPTAPPGGDYWVISSIGVDGSVLALGDPAYEQVFVFEQIAGEWQQVAVISEPDPQNYEYFGYSVAVEGDVIVVGEPVQTDAERPGRAFVFRRSGPPPNNWVLEQTLKGSKAKPGHQDWFGFDVAMGGGRIAVTAPLTKVDHPQDPTIESAAYVFEQDSTGVWQEVMLAEADEEHLMGNSVAISASHLIVGAIDTDQGGITTGSAFAYHLPFGTTTCLGQPHSSGVATLTLKGSPAISANALTLGVTGLPPGQPAVLFAAPHRDHLPQFGGGAGTLCLGGSLTPLGPPQLSGAGGEVALTLDLLASSPLQVLAGETWHFQAWFRDENPLPTSNLSGAVAVEFR